MSIGVTSKPGMRHWGLPLMSICAAVMGAVPARAQQVVVAARRRGDRMVRRDPCPKRLSAAHREISSPRPPRPGRSMPWPQSRK